MNPELGQLGDDDAYRRWQARTTNYRRDGKSSRAHAKKNGRNPSGQTGGYHQDQDQVNSYSGNPGNPHTSDYHGGAPPSPASSAPAAAQIASVSSPRAPTPSVAYSHGAVPAKGTSVASAVPLNPGTISTKGTRASCAVPIDHGPSSAKGTRVHSAVPLSRGLNSATGVRVSIVAPLNHGTGACASRAAPPRPRVAQQ